MDWYIKRGCAAAADVALAANNAERRSKDRSAGSAAAGGLAADEMRCNGVQHGSIAAFGSSPSAASSWESHGTNQARSNLALPAKSPKVHGTEILRSFDAASELSAGPLASPFAALAGLQPLLAAGESPSARAAAEAPRPGAGARSAMLLP